MRPASAPTTTPVPRGRRSDRHPSCGPPARQSRIRAPAHPTLTRACSRLLQRPMPQLHQVTRLISPATFSRLSKRLLEPDQLVTDPALNVDAVIHQLAEEVFPAEDVP